MITTPEPPFPPACVAPDTHPEPPPPPPVLADAAVGCEVPVFPLPPPPEPPLDAEAPGK